MQVTTFSNTQARWKVVLAFALVYVFWGSTYLAIRIAVEEIPPALMAGTRFLIAGTLMLAFCVVRGKRVSITAAEALRLATIGVLLLTTSNVLVAWAEQWVPTGLAALLVSITPIWFLILETWVFRGEHRVSSRALAGIALGILGVAVLIWPELRNAAGIGRRELVGCLVLLSASLSWATGSVLSKRWKVGVDAFAATGWEMTFAGVVNVLAGLAFGDQHRANWSARGLGAVFYLVIFGSWVGFTAYIWLLKHVPTTKVATYAYVNPVVAVFLGWFVLNERVTGFILAGSVIIVAAVAIVSGAELKTRDELPAVEATGD